MKLVTIPRAATGSSAGWKNFVYHPFPDLSDVTIAHCHPPAFSQSHAGGVNRVIAGQFMIVLDTTNMNVAPHRRLATPRVGANVRRTESAQVVGIAPVNGFWPHQAAEQFSFSSSRCLAAGSLMSIGMALAVRTARAGGRPRADRPFTACVDRSQHLDLLRDDRLNDVHALYYRQPGPCAVVEAISTQDVRASIHLRQDSGALEGAVNGGSANGEDLHEVGDGVLASGVHAGELSLLAG